MTFSRVHYSVLVVVFRPHWEKCGQYVEGGTDRWNELSQDRSSDELVDILLAEMTGQDIAIIQAGVNTGAEYFTGQVYYKFKTLRRTQTSSDLFQSRLASVARDLLVTSVRLHAYYPLSICHTSE